MPRIRYFLAVILLSAGPAWATPIHEPGLAVLPDPDPAKAPHFSPAAATSGAAIPSPALDRANIVATGCAAANPCALPIRVQEVGNKKTAHALPRRPERS